MQCLKNDGRLSAWVDGELSGDDARAVEAHVDHCAVCGEFAASLRAWSFPELGPDPSFIARFRERRDEQSIAPWWTWRQLALRLLPLAAVLLLAALVSVWVSGRDDSLQALEHEALGAPVAFESGPEAVLSIALEPFPEDGR